MPRTMPQAQINFYAPRSSGVGGWRCQGCDFDTLSRCLACDVACCGGCLIRHECEQ